MRVRVRVGVQTSWSMVKNPRFSPSPIASNAYACTMGIFSTGESPARRSVAAWPGEGVRDQGNGGYRALESTAVQSPCSGIPILRQPAKKETKVDTLASSATSVSSSSSSVSLRMVRCSRREICRRTTATAPR